RPKQTAFFRVFNNPQGRAVLDRTARVHEFGFAQNLATGQFGQSPQAQKRRATDVTFYAKISCRAYGLQPNKDRACREETSAWDPEILPGASMRWHCRNGYGKRGAKVRSGSTLDKRKPE